MVRAHVCASIVTLLAWASVTSAVVIPTVPVGDPGNLPDQEHGGYGSVAYAFEIGKYEVTASQYCGFLNAVAGVDTYNLYDTTMSRTDYGSGIARAGAGTVAVPYTYSVAVDFANRPVNYVSYWDACRFANWVHNGQPTGAQETGTTETGAYTLSGYTGHDGRGIQRNSDWKWAVASEDEWYKAAYCKGGSVNADYWDYPTASNTAPGRDMADVFGNNANYYNGTGPIDAGKYTTIVGEFQNSESPYGTFDQGGNVYEWNEAVVSDSARGLRGGSFGGNHFLSGHGALRASYRNGYFPPSGEDSHFGFRLVAVPEPSTLVLLVLTLGSVVRRAGR